MLYLTYALHRKKKSSMIPAQIGCKWDSRPPLEIHFHVPIMLLFLCWIAINIFFPSLFWHFFFCAKVSWTWLICMNPLSPEANTFQQQWMIPARIRNGQNIPTVFDSSGAADLWKEVISPAKSGPHNSPLSFQQVSGMFSIVLVLPAASQGTNVCFLLKIRPFLYCSASSRRLPQYLENQFGKLKRKLAKHTS